jgi:predicted ATPase
MTSSAGRHLQRIEVKGEVPDLAAWPFSIPAVAQLLQSGGLDIPPGVTFLIGENGSGKSTLVEAFAAVYPRFGVARAVQGPSDSAEDSPLRWHLRAKTHPMASPGGFFLRAELMHAYLVEADRNVAAKRAWDNEQLMEKSHGEQFLAVLRHRFNDIGVYFLDEPEAALSFQSCLGLLALLDDIRREGSQAVVATHSPLLASLPEATLFELGDWGIRETTFEQLELVGSWRSFLEAPGRYLRHLLQP